MPAVAIAQVPSQTFRPDAGSSLSAHMQTLSRSPNDLYALKGAARAALELGDVDGALAFLARAEQNAPRDGEVKALMGSAFLGRDDYQAAARFFGEAQGLGYSAANYGGDRGLVYDLNGDPRRAQADYRAALSRGEDDEVRRRLALSLAIDGKQDEALSTLRAQLQRQDRAALRTRAFILALGGDTREAVQAADTAMPGQGKALEPFLARLPALTLADRAKAVHLGQFPAYAETIQLASRETPRNESSRRETARTETRRETPRRSEPSRSTRRSTSIDDLDPSVRRRLTPEQLRALERGESVTVRRAPAVIQPEQRPEPPQRQLADVPPPPPAPEPAPQPAYADVARESLPPAMTPAQPAPQPAAASTPPAPTPSQPGIRTQALPPSNLAEASPSPSGAAFGPPDTGGGNNVPLAAPAAAAPPPTSAPAPTQAEPVRVVPAKPGFADIASLVGTLEDPDGSKARRAEAPPAPEPKAEEKPDAADAPRRLWVQIASSPNQGLLPGEFRRLRGKTDALKGQSAYIGPMGNMHRLLVGPFESGSAASTLVNEMAKAGIKTFAWTSPAGVAIEKLPGT